jgi:hypothetical protein
VAATVFLAGLFAPEPGHANNVPIVAVGVKLRSSVTATGTIKGKILDGNSPHTPLIGACAVATDGGSVFQQSAPTCRRGRIS